MTLEPCAAAGGTVQLSVLQGATISCTAGGTIDLAGDGAHYLVVPQFATGDVSNTSVAYTIGVPSAGVTASVANGNSERQQRTATATDFKLISRITASNVP